MNMNLPMILQGLGASLTALSDPRQSIQMSQAIFDQWQAEERQRRAEQERAQEMAFREREMAMQEQEAAREQQARETAQTRFASLMGSYGGGGATQYANGTPPPPTPYELAGGAIPYTAMYTPGMGGDPQPWDKYGANDYIPLPAVASLLQLGESPLASIEAPAAPPPPGAISPRQLRAIAAVGAGDAQKGAEMLAQAEAQASRQTSAMRLAREMMRADGASESELGSYLERAARLQSGAPASPTLSSITYDETWGKAPEGQGFQRDPRTGEVVVTQTVDAQGNVLGPRPATYALFPEPPSSVEEVRNLALADDVIERTGRALTAINNFKGDWANAVTYVGASLPWFGKFFSDTFGGAFYDNLRSAVMSSTYQVSGAEAPPREVQERMNQFMPNAWDSPDRIRMKLDGLRSVSEKMRAYRLGEGLSKNDQVPEAVHRRIFDTVDAEMEAKGLILPPASYVPDEGFELYDYVPRFDAFRYANPNTGEEYYARRSLMKQ